MRLSCNKINARLRWGLLGAVAFAVMSSESHGAPANFNVSVSPPRFELKAKPGKVVRETIRISNADTETGNYVVKTADWTLSEKAGLTFNEGSPHQGSCRPWVRIERRTFRLISRGTKTYRFEVHVPAGVKPGECRFALLISLDPKSIKPVQMGNITVPVVGRIAVIVYVAVGSAKPVLRYQGVEMRVVRGKPIPVVLFQNTGNAPGRPFGSVRAKDATGRRVEMVLQELPILPGQTRAVELRPVDWARQGATDVTYTLKVPMNIRGKLQWDGGSIRLDQVLR